jgi:hypothetical protein
MHFLYSSSAYAYNRCTRGCDVAEVQQPEPEAQDMPLTVKEPGDVVVECPDHKLCNFVKGKSRSIISLLIS